MTQAGASGQVVHNKRMTIESTFAAVFADAVASDLRVSSVLQNFVPLDLAQWDLKETAPAAERQQAAVLAFPKATQAGLYLVISSPEGEGALAADHYAFEIMADAPDNGCELLVAQRRKEGFEVLYVDLALEESAGGACLPPLG